MIVENRVFSRVSFDVYERANKRPWKNWRHGRVSEYIARYQWAVEELNKNGDHQAVVDAACGCGWGTNFLAQKTDRQPILGVDIDSQTIYEAKNHFDNPKTVFIQHDIRDNPEKITRLVTPSSIVSFETLEHLSLEDASLALKNFSQMLKNGGVLFVSTPNREIFSPFPRSLIPDHLHEFSETELTQAIKTAGFHITELLGQRLIEKDVFQKFAKKLSKIIQTDSPQRRTIILSRLLTLYFVMTDPSKAVKPFDQSGKKPVVFIVKCEI